MQQRRTTKLLNLLQLLRFRKPIRNQMLLLKPLLIIIFAHPRHASEKANTLCPACRGRVLRGCASLPLPLTRTTKPLRPLAPHKARPQKTARAKYGRACRRKRADLRQKPAQLPLSPLTLSASGFFIAHSVGGSAPLPCLGSGSSAPPSVPRLSPALVPASGAVRLPAWGGSALRVPLWASPLRSPLVPFGGSCLGVLLPGCAFFLPLLSGVLFFFVSLCVLNQ